MSDEENTTGKKTTLSFSEYLAGAAFSAKDFLSQQMNQSGGGEEGEKEAKEELRKLRGVICEGCEEGEKVSKKEE